MLSFWLRIGMPVFYCVVAACIIGLFSSVTVGLACLVPMLLTIMTYRAQQISKIIQWLRNPSLNSIPDGVGVWDDIFSMLYKMTKQHNQTKQELAAELEYIQKATAALPEGVVILNEYNRIEWSNPLAQQHFGLDAERDLMQDITYLVRQPEFVDYLRAAKFKQPLVMRPARHHDMVLSIRFIAYGENKRLLLSSDITQFDKIESMRRSFVADVSHELRTPLTVVNGYVENLQDMPDLDPAQAQRMLALIAEQTQRMQTLVTDLLTLSTLENDQMPVRKTRVDIKQMLEDVYQEGLSLSQGRHQLVLTMTTDLTIDGNAKELRSAFANLLGNAIRYTPDGGIITIAWYERVNQPIFSVQDTGIGIAAQHLSRLTERFYRVDSSRSRDSGGTGLGLAIVKSVVQRHMARLQIKSVEGEGSTFLIIFPHSR